MADTLTIDTTRLIARAKALAVLASDGFTRVAVPAVNKALAVGHVEIVRLLSGPVLRRRTGNAAASVRSVPAQAEGGSVIGKLVSAVHYLHFLFKGGIIKPRKGQFLAIPIGNALTPAGVSRYPSPRDAGELIFIPRTKAGNTILARRKPDGGLDPLFVLKKQVEIPPHDFLSGPKQKMLLMLRQTLPASFKEAL